MRPLKTDVREVNFKQTELLIKKPNPGSPAARRDSMWMSQSAPQNIGNVRNQHGTGIVYPETHFQ